MPEPVGPDPTSVTMDAPRPDSGSASDARSSAEPVPGDQPAAEGTKPGGKPFGIVAALVLVVLAFGILIWLTSDPERQAAIEAMVQSPTGLAVLFGLAVLSSATLILPAPGLALTAIAGAAGDPLTVGMVAGLGQAVGELTGYLAGRSGRSLLPETNAANRVAGWVGRWGMAVIFVLAVIPNPIFDIAGIAAGALNMPLVRYLGSAAAGKVIKNVIVANGGSLIVGVAILRAIA